jgi:hypothetical protein
MKDCGKALNYKSGFSKGKKLHDSPGFFLHYSPLALSIGKT